MKTLIQLAILIGTLLLTGCEQARVDAQMAELCAKDGGMKIYETVVLPKDQFSEYGDPRFFVTWNERGGEYFFSLKSEYIKNSPPSLLKMSSSIVRQKDNKTLGNHVYYLRREGDILPRLGPDSAKGCPEGVNDIQFIHAVFVREIKEKI